jgi:SAM-dependent methyltransferase
LNAARLSPELAAELYRLTHRGNPGDVAFYRSLCSGAQSVLELGSGYGRLLEALAVPQRQLVGLELDEGLLELSRRELAKLPAARRRSLCLVPGDMRRFQLAQRFERVLLPYNGLYCLLNRRQAASCLRCARRALTPNGVLALDVWNADPFHAAPAEQPQEEATPLFGIVHRRRRLQVFEASRLYASRQRLDVDYTYVPEGAGITYGMRLRQRYFRSGELFELLESTGFRVVKRYGSFARGRFTPRSAQLIVLATPV